MTMIYAHVQQATRSVISPLDNLAMSGLSADDANCTIDITIPDSELCPESDMQHRKICCYLTSGYGKTQR